MKLLGHAASFLRRMAGTGRFKVGAHFGKIYRENLFGGTESRSGTGSSLEQTAQLRRELPRLIAEMGMRSFLDAPCGDCHWIAELDWSTTVYTGVDVVLALIQENQVRLKGHHMRFVAADLCTNHLPKADLIFCRDCWVHLDYRQIKACLENFRRSGAEYLLTTTFTSRSKNRDLHGAIWRPLNLQAAPFAFPTPVRLLVEGCTEGNGSYADKSMGLWRLEDLSF